MLLIQQVTQPWRGSLAVETCTCGSNTQERQQRARIQLSTSISLLCILSKVLERCVFNRLYKHLAPVLQDAQHGFIRGRSTVTELLTFLHDIGAALDKGLETDVVYLDFSKAFDSVDHGKLVLKLKQRGVEGNLLSWLANYLSDRKQRTVVSGHYQSLSQLFQVCRKVLFSAHCCLSSIPMTFRQLQRQVVLF